MTENSPICYFKISPDIIRLAVILYVRLPPSLRNVEDLLHERGVEVSHEIVRFWWKRFGPMFASDITRKRRNKALIHSYWQLQLDEGLFRLTVYGTTFGVLLVIDMLN
jgi:putative transposase